FKKLSVLIEDLNSVVVPIGHKESPPRIHRKTMRRVKLAGSRALLAPGHQKLSVLVVLHYSRVCVSTVSVRDEDVAVRSGNYIGRLIECILSVSRDAGFAECQENLAFVAELDDDMAFARGSRIIRAAGWDPVGYPDVAFFVDMNAVRKDKHAGAEASNELAGLVKFQDRGQV